MKTSEFCNQLTQAVVPQRHLLRASRDELLNLFAKMRLPIDVTYCVLSYLVDANRLTAKYLPDIEACIAGENLASRATLPYYKSMFADRVLVKAHTILLKIGRMNNKNDVNSDDVHVPSMERSSSFLTLSNVV